MFDLIERLRDMADLRHRDRGNDAVDDALREAATEISALRRRVEELEGALETMRQSRDGYANQGAERLRDARRLAIEECAKVAYAKAAKVRSAGNITAITVAACISEVADAILALRDNGRAGE